MGNVTTKEVTTKEVTIKDFKKVGVVNQKPGARYGHCMVNNKNNIYLFGGALKFYRCYNDLWEFSCLYFYYFIIFVFL